MVFFYHVVEQSTSRVTVAPDPKLVSKGDLLDETENEGDSALFNRLRRAFTCWRLIPIISARVCWLTFGGIIVPRPSLSCTREEITRARLSPLESTIRLARSDWILTFCARRKAAKLKAGSPPATIISFTRRASIFINSTFVSAIAL